MGHSQYVRPACIEDALAALAARPLTVLAGGTDFYPARVGRLLQEDVLDISRLSALRGISLQGPEWHIGALTTWTDVLRHPLPRLFDGLKLAARAVGGAQIQNTGTVAGNLCNASPAADGVPALLALSAEVELACARGTRRLPLVEFITGKRTTQRLPDELMTAILVPARGSGARSTFAKLGARRYLVISIGIVAVTVEPGEDGRIGHAAVAVGACSAVAVRLPALEVRLRGRPLTPDLGDLPRPADLAVLSPVSDVRATADYRRDAVLTLIRRALRGLANE